MSLFHDVPVKATGRLKIVLTDEKGQVKETREIDNLVVLAGRAFMASRMAGTAAAVMSHMALGTSTQAAAAGDTGLITEIGGSRVALGSTTPSSNQVTYAASFGAGVGTGAVTEAGIFNAGAAGTMLARTVFSVVNKAAGDTMSISWVITLS